MLSIINAAVVLAHEKGYIVTVEGFVIAPSGRKRKLYKRIQRAKRSCGSTRPVYLSFSIKDKRGIVVHIPVHRFAMYQVHKEALFDHGVVVRHLDNNHQNNRLHNLAIGSHSDNRMDEPEEMRLNRAKHAAKSLQKLSSSQVKSLRRDRQNGMDYKQLHEKYGIAKSCISRIVNGTLYRDVL